MMSTTTATLSPQVAGLLRGALHSELVRACEDMPERPESLTRAGWAPVRRRLNAAFRGLDLIGWEEPEQQEAVTIALDTMMIEALETDAELIAGRQSRCGPNPQRVAHALRGRHQ